MNVYIYAADIWCEDCGRAIHERITSESIAPEDPSNREGYFNSIDFPKGPYPDGGGEADLPQHCAAGENCLVAFHCSDGRKIGVWLENELTEEGVTYVKEAVKEGGYVANLWFEWYLDLDYIL
ncbi:hypothetical protein LCGC14_2178540 [marine sediment metagenome]|uniref:Uncharacterized protein n=1 Tax=marine sediment metagenome TaxID=412755 RepID=A0A0F9EA46_9ZZZZ